MEPNAAVKAMEARYGPARVHQDDAYGRGFVRGWREGYEAAASPGLTCSEAHPGQDIYHPGGHPGEIAASPEAECICGEINSRHCPVHNEVGRPSMKRRFNVTPGAPAYRLGANIPLDEIERFIAVAEQNRRSLTQEVRLALAAWVQLHDPKFDGLEQHGT